MATQTTEAPKISKSLEGKYELVRVGPGPFVFGGMKYDTTTMDASTAAKLVKEGCPYIKEKGSASPAGKVNP